MESYRSFLNRKWHDHISVLGEKKLMVSGGIRGSLRMMGALAGVAQWIESAGLWTKGHWFNSQSGHMPGLWARSSVGGTREATTHWCFPPSLSPSFLSLKLNKILKNEGNHSSHFDYNSKGKPSRNVANIDKMPLKDVSEIRKRKRPSSLDNQLNMGCEGD